MSIIESRITRHELSNNNIITDSIIIDYRDVPLVQRHGAFGSSKKWQNVTKSASKHTINLPNEARK